MSLKVTERKVRELLEEMLIDLTKAENGNKAAAQRVRTKSIAFAKIAKEYRKFSINAERKVPKKSTSAKKSAKKAPAAAAKTRRKR